MEVFNRIAIVILTLIGLSEIVARAQGQFIFNNYVPPDINARFILGPNVDPPDGSSSSIGPGWHIDLLGGPKGTPFPQLVPLQPSSTDFRADNPATYGYVNPITVTVPGVPPGG